MKKLLKKLIPNFLFSAYHWKLAFLGALIYGFPSRKLKVIGVTGTKGKSTVVMLAGRVLAEAGHKVGWVSSLTINDGKKEMMNPFHMTMPGRFFIQKTLAALVKNGCEYALVEVTSEGIKQSRHKFVDWAGAVFSNLAPEHIEAHGSFARYREAKLELFRTVAKNPEGFGVYNLDDENVVKFLETPIKNKYGYSLKSQITNFSLQTKYKIQVLNIRLNANGSEFEIIDTKFKTNLLGEFNVANAAAAIAVGQACGVNLETAAKALAKIESIPGRLEIINEGQDFTVVVDLAHTPDSFEKVFRLFKDLTQGRIISVFGSAGGGRDKWKRPELGKIASANSGTVIICNEDPYEEDPLSIADSILSGCDKNKTDIVLDRREAISRSLAQARSGDVVLILGKGTEQTMVVGNKKFHWDDRDVTREELNKIIRKK